MARDTDTNDVVEPAAEGPICPECGHTNIPGAVFCSRCGHALSDDAPQADVIDVDRADSQATSTFRPVASTVTPPSTSPWARPGTMDGDPGQTSVLPAALPVEQVGEFSPIAPSPVSGGPRGFLLGMIALLLILAVLAVYIYVAWLGDSTRSSVDGWLPWM